MLGGILSQSLGWRSVFRREDASEHGSKPLQVNILVPMYRLGAVRGDHDTVRSGRDSLNMLLNRILGFFQRPCGLSWATVAYDRLLSGALLSQ